MTISHREAARRPAQHTPVLSGGLDVLDGPPSWRQRGRPQPVDEAEDFPKQLPRHGDFGQLERDVPAMSHDLRADLDQLLPLLPAG